MKGIVWTLMGLWSSEDGALPPDSVWAINWPLLDDGIPMDV